MASPLTVADGSFLAIPNGGGIAEIAEGGGYMPMRVMS